MGKVLFMRKGETHTVPEGIKPLNDCTWEEIRAISDAGKASKWFNIGDCKEITLNGTLGHVTFSNYKTYAFIIGIDHNEELEGSNRIHFQLAKTALSGGTDIAFCDSAYASTVSTTGYFCMNSSGRNSGGWKGCYMRTNTCGTSLSSSYTTMLTVIPSELRSVIKTVTKYTDNTGKSTEESAVTATTDYFFLLSEYEVFGTIGQSNPYEANKQKQYPYYSAGNSKVKYKHGDTSTYLGWWLRSPDASSNATYMHINAFGNYIASGAKFSLGFAPAFCV